MPHAPLAFAWVSGAVTKLFGLLAGAMLGANVDFYRVKNSTQGPDTEATGGEDWALQSGDQSAGEFEGLLELDVNASDANLQRVHQSKVLEGILVSPLCAVEPLRVDRRIGLSLLSIGLRVWNLGYPAVFPHIHALPGDY